VGKVYGKMQKDSFANRTNTQKAKDFEQEANGEGSGFIIIFHAQ
jgi:hypothetical protein